MSELSLEALESSIEALETVDEFNSSVDYDKFIVLSKKELSNFCRICEPLTKVAIDDYGKSVLVECIGNDSVRLTYTNSPYLASIVVSNKSGKQVKSFALSVSTLKKLVTSSFSSIILVEENDEINIALCESLLFLETKPLNNSVFSFIQEETPNVLDKDLALYTFRKIGSSLSLTDRASEKVILNKGEFVHFNTGVFASKSKSPFTGGGDFVIYKQVSDLIAVLSEISSELTYSIIDNKLSINCDSKIYIEAMVGDEEKVQQFSSPTLDQALKFDANISILNDNLLRLVSVVKSLEYLSDIVTLNFLKDSIEFTISSSDHKKKSVYKFSIVEGAPETLGNINLTVDVLQMFLNIVGSSCTYSFNEVGLGIKNETGNFLIRKS